MKKDYLLTVMHEIVDLHSATSSSSVKYIRNSQNWGVNMKLGRWTWKGDFLLLALLKLQNWTPVNYTHILLRSVVTETCYHTYNVETFVWNLIKLLVSTSTLINRTYLKSCDRPCKVNRTYLVKLAFMENKL